MDVGLDTYINFFLSYFKQKYLINEISEVEAASSSMFEMVNAVLRCGMEMQVLMPTSMPFYIPLELEDLIFAFSYGKGCFYSAS